MLHFQIGIFCDKTSGWPVNKRKMQEAFKFYKNKTKEPDLSEVIDCTAKDNDKVSEDSKEVRRDNFNFGSFQVTKIGVNPLAVPRVGILPAGDWEVFKFQNKPGLFLIKNPFTPIGQRYWIRKLLEDYTKHPHPNNLLPSRFSEKVIQDFWSSLNNESDEQHKRLIKKSMRWTTLGYHYDWTNKIYDENFKNEFPRDLHELTTIFAEALGFENYKSEAAIINFYPVGTTLSAHTDHSEFFLDSPLFSISFGQSAIFLIGGTEREDETLPILLSSGDILVMSGQSRLCYHAVPRVFKTERKVWNVNEDTCRCQDLPQDDLKEILREDEWARFEDYLTDSRINVNIRQVNK